jgi:hypothetical protein
MMYAIEMGSIAIIFIPSFIKIGSDILKLIGGVSRGGGYLAVFLTFSFTYQIVNKEDHPQYVVCGEVLANSSFSVRNLHRHLTTKHDSVGNKPLHFFERKLLEMCKELNLQELQSLLKRKYF